jgi:heparan-alpha-glucosaminide N-acetyltransferase
MTNYNRISSIDITRGLTLFLMLFLNDLNMKVAPAWLGNFLTGSDGMGLAGWIFPGFLFLAGMSIPFSLSKRFSRGDTLPEISRHILKRFVSLVAIGVLMINAGRVNPELTGFNQYIWTILMFLGVFLFWNDYPNREDRFFTVTGLKLLGLTIIVLLIFKFKSGQVENNGSLVTDWWGYPGLAGWGYLVAAFTYVAFRDSYIKTAFTAAFFLLLNMLSSWNLIILPDIIQTIFGVLIGGNIPLFVLSGLLAGLVLKKTPTAEFKKALIILLAMGSFCIIAGFVLHNWFKISEIKGAPDQALKFCGISLFVLIPIYWTADVKGHIRWAGFLRPAGENSLTTYLSPELLYCLIRSSGFTVLFYKLSPNPLIAIAGSLVWSLMMVRLTALLLRLNIRLKL